MLSSCRMPYRYVKDKGDEALPRCPPVHLPGASSSTASEIPPTLELPLITLDGSSLPVSVVAKAELYNLNDITRDHDHHHDKSVSDDRCQRFLYRVVRFWRHGKWCDHFRGLLPLFCSTTIVPDAFILRCVRGRTVLVLLVEVQSSDDFASTIRKCVFDVIDQFRFYRIYCSTVSSVTGFAFPKLKDGRKLNKKSVVKVTVSMEDLKFCYKLETIERVTAIEGSLHMAIAQNESCLSGLSGDSLQIDTEDPEQGI